MRTTKNLTISLPPQQLREMERTAKKENRTMSELMREAFRRYQLDEAQRQLLADPKRAEHLAQLQELLSQLRTEATAKGLDKITERQIASEVEAVRKQRRGRKNTKRSAK